jgi:hypothetical protein
MTAKAYSAVLAESIAISPAVACAAPQFLPILGPLGAMGGIPRWSGSGR